MSHYPACPGCRVADVRVQMAIEVRDDCPHCGTVLVESLRICCIPDCDAALPVTDPLPLCKPCGIKVALVYRGAAAAYEPAAMERRRVREQREAERLAKLARDAVVYYVRLDENRIKIGYTSLLKQRLKSLRAHPSALLAIEPGGREVERARHEQFAAERIERRTEEFAPTTRLLEWIEEVRLEHDLPHWAKVPDTRVVRR